MVATEPSFGLWTDLLNYNCVDLPSGGSVTIVHCCPELFPKGQSPEYIIPASARTSYGKYTLDKTEEQNKKLIARLYRDRHTSPFEMASVTFLIKVPKYVAIHLLRHRTAKVNEESQRYTEVKTDYQKLSKDPGFYIRKQCKKNKQSSEVFNEEQQLQECLSKVIEMEKHVDAIFDLYHECIGVGMARECARAYLPMATFTTLAYQMDMSNFMKFFCLRAAPDAQYETREVAFAMGILVKQLFPFMEETFDQFSSIGENVKIVERLAFSEKDLD